MANNDFNTYLSWMEPDVNDDLIRSAKANNSSNNIEKPGNYANIEKNPFRPSTDGEYETDQPGTLTFNDIFAGNHPNFGTPTGTHNGTNLRWWIHNDLKWIYDPDPGNVQTDPDFWSTWENNTLLFPTAELEPDLEFFRDVTLTTNTIDAEISGGEDFQYTGAGILQRNGSGPFVDIVCRYNDVQRMINGVVDDQIIALEALRIASSEFIDTFGGSAEDALFWDDIETIHPTLIDLTTKHAAWRAANDPFPEAVGATYTTSGNPGAAAVVFQDHIKVGATSFYNTLFAPGTGRLDTILNRIGTPTTSGYAKELYDVMNAAAGNTIGFVKDVISAYLSISATYDHINLQRTKYRFYDDAIED